MRIPYSERPGRHERHYRRKAGNPLFVDTAVEATDSALLDAQRRDHEELVAFMSGLRDLVQRAVDLRPNEDSQVVLDLKSELDRAYETASALAEDQSGNKDAIRQLTSIVMAAVRASAGPDAMAARQLDEEDEARRIHYLLLEHALVAELLAPDSLILPRELAPTLLSAEESALDAALELFDADQLTLLCRDARAVLGGVQDAAGALTERAADRLRRMEARLEALMPGDRPESGAIA